MLNVSFVTISIYFEVDALAALYTTPGIEGMYATIRKYLKISTHNIEIIFGRLDDAITAHKNDTKQ